MIFNQVYSHKLWPILEVGPGSIPSQYSDVWLDLEYQSTAQTMAQSANAMPVVGKPKVYYNGKKFPFKDKAFKYVIASQVIEHVPWESLPLFINELQRVAHAGYIEMPRWTYEILFDYSVHISTGDVKNHKLIIYKKIQSDTHYTFTKLLIEKSQKLRDYLYKEKELYFCYMKWQDKIAYELIDNDYPGNLCLKDMNYRANEDFEKYIKIERFHDFVNLAEDFKILFNTIKNKLNSLYNFGMKKRKIVDEKILLSLLQCPVTGSIINEKLENKSSSFKFIKTDNEYRPFIMK